MFLSTLEGLESQILEKVHLESSFSQNQDSKLENWKKGQDSWPRIVEQ
jgi:hypothetical protein